MIRFDQKRAVVRAVDELRGLYEELCIHLNDADRSQAVWELIRKRNELIDSTLARQGYELGSRPPHPAARAGTSNQARTTI